MRYFTRLATLVACGASFAAVAPLSAASMMTGKAEIRSAGPLAFGAGGILFVGDSVGASVYALDTADTAKVKAAMPVEIKGVNQKIAALLGTTPDQILINDVVLNPSSKNMYISVSRGKGPDATPVILKADSAGKLTELSLDNIKHARVSLSDAPESKPDARGRNPRMEAITDLAFVDGKVLVAGLSNEEFSSSLRSINYPFGDASKATGIEIYHGQHGRFETNAPIRTFLPYTVAGKPHLLAAYTCTPLVRIPMSDLKPAAKVKGTTIAELGNRNRPLDMIAYKKDGKDFILMANSSRGVMKLPADGLDKYQPITAQTEMQGVPFETISTLTGVQQLDKLDEQHALVLADNNGSLDLRSIALP